MVVLEDENRSLLKDVAILQDELFSVKYLGSDEEIAFEEVNGHCFRQ